MKYTGNKMSPFHLGESNVYKREQSVLLHVNLSLVQKATNVINNLGTWKTIESTLTLGHEKIPGRGRERRKEGGTAMSSMTLGLEKILEFTLTSGQKNLNGRQEKSGGQMRVRK